MNTLETVLLMLLVLDAISLGALVLLQHGKGADVGAAFGSGSSNTMFGSAGGAPFLTKLTVWLAIGFFVISFGLAYSAKQRATSLGELGVPQVADPAPAMPSLEPIADDQPPLVEAPALPVVPELTDDLEGVDSDIPDV